MTFYTPLRYPGGKRRLLPFVRRLLEVNCLRNVNYVEPCAGGASLALALLYEEYASTIHINDLSRPVFAFWHCVLNDTDRLCSKIESTAVTMEEWYRQRLVFKNSDTVELSDLGFATFFLNRTNRSGIISGGVIGGQKQTGKWKLDSRFTKGELIRRIRRVSEYRDRIHLYSKDALDFTNEIVAGLGLKVLAFYDPPYIDLGNALYLNNYVLDDHRKLSNAIRQIPQHWIVTYDYEAAVRYELFPGHRRMSFELSYSAQDRRRGREAMFFSTGMLLPDDWKEDEVASMSAAGSNHPVLGKLEQVVSR